MRQRVGGQDSGERRLHGLKVRAGGVLNIGCPIHLPIERSRSIYLGRILRNNLNIYCPCISCTNSPSCTTSLF